VIEWRQQYADPERDASLGFLAGSVNTEPDLAVQAFKDESDINTMMRRFGITGQLSQSASEPFYGDFTDVSDYHAALERVRSAQAEFATLPAAVRARFGNDPAELIGFMQDPNNEGEARKLGLLPDKPISLDGSPAPKVPE